MRVLSRALWSLRLISLTPLSRICRLSALLRIPLASGGRVHSVLLVVLAEQVAEKGAHLRARTHRRHVAILVVSTPRDARRQLVGSEPRLGVATCRSLQPLVRASPLVLLCICTLTRLFSCVSSYLASHA